MTRYTFFLDITLVLDTPRTPAQLRKALIETAPTIRQALKQAVKAQLAKDPTGKTTAIKWHINVTTMLKGDVLADNAEELEDVGIDLDDGIRFYEEES